MKFLHVFVFAVIVAAGILFAYFILRPLEDKAILCKKPIDKKYAILYHKEKGYICLRKSDSLYLDYNNFYGTTYYKFGSSEMFDNLKIFKDTCELKNVLEAIRLDEITVKDYKPVK